jgi:GT2 family glycosyltransferase
VNSVAAIVLHWNKLEVTAPCCESLRRIRAPGALRLLVVDNGSTAHDAPALRAACPGADILRLDGNLGFAGGMNAGMRAALAAGADFVWLLNNDTLCEPGALEELLAPMAADPRTGAVSSRLRQAGAPPSAPPSGGLLRLRPPLWIPRETRPGEAGDYLCGTSLLVRAAALREVGPLDEGFPFFFEDADWSFRARAAGWRLAETARAAVVHAGSASIALLGRRQAACYREGHVRFLRRHARRPLPPALGAFLWRILVQAATLRRDALRGSIDGWRGGWRGDLSIRGVLDPARPPPGNPAP